MFILLIATNLQPMLERQIFEFGQYLFPLPYHLPNLQQPQLLHFLP